MLSMETAIHINRIIKEIESLDYSDKINILSRIAGMLKKTNTAQLHTDITSLRGMGKDLWQKIDVDSYISNERSSWD
jgi:hypothetical protein